MKEDANKNSTGSEQPGYGRTASVVQHKYLDLSKSVAIAFYGGGSPCDELRSFK